jgi:hypothetical protein
MLGFSVTDKAVSAYDEDATSMALPRGHAASTNELS